MKPAAFLLAALLLLPAPALRAQDGKLKALQGAVVANPNNPDAHFNLGLEYFNRSQYDLALPEFEKASRLNPNDQQAKELTAFTKGYISYNQGDYNAALKGFQETLKVNPKNPNAAQLLGVAYIQLKDYGNAEKALAAYVASFPDKNAQLGGNLNLAKVYVAQKKYTEAVTCLQKVAALDPGNFEALNNLGVAYFQNGDFAGAADAWHKAAAHFRKDTPAADKASVFKYLGYSTYRAGKLQEAIDSYHKSLEYNPNDADVLYNLGVADLDAAAYDDAADAFKRAFAANPNDSNAALGQAQAIDAAINGHMEKGSSFLLNSQYTEAIKEWKKVLEYQSDHAQATALIADAQQKLGSEVARLYESGNASAHAGRTLDALQQWNSALAMDPENAKVKQAIQQLNLKTGVKVSSLSAAGDEALASGDYELAKDKYQQALRVTPTAALKAKLAKALEAQKLEYDKAFAAGDKAEKGGNLRSAIQSYTKALSVAPGRAEAKGRLDSVRVKRSMMIEQNLKDGQALWEGGNGKAAQEKFNAVLAMDPNNEKANDYIKKITGQMSRARVDADEVKRIYYEGVNLYINGKIEDAIAKWQECLKMDPGNVNALSNINKAKSKLSSIQKLRQG